MQIFEHAQMQWPPAGRLLNPTSRHIIIQIWYGRADKALRCQRAFCAPGEILAKGTLRQRTVPMDILNKTWFKPMLIQCLCNAH